MHVQTVGNFPSQSVASGFLPPDGLEPEEPKDDPNPNPEEGLDPDDPEDDPEEVLDPNLVLDWLPLQRNLHPRHLSLHY